MSAHTYRHLPRRDFLRMAGLTAVGGSAVFAAARDGGDEDDRATTTGPEGSEADVKILNSALDLENTAIALYTAGVELLRGKALEAGRQFLRQEQEHAESLSQAIKELGGTPTKAKSAEEYARGFPTLSDQTDVLRFAVDLENTAVAAYTDAIPKLSAGRLRQTAGGINANEAEHISVLLGLLQRPQVPDAFVTGKAG
jgi:rubrerythrin